MRLCQGVTPWLSLINHSTHLFVLPDISDQRKKGSLCAILHMKFPIIQSETRA